MRLAYWMDIRSPHAQRWAEAFAARGHDVRVLTPRADPATAVVQAPLPAPLCTAFARRMRLTAVGDHLRAPVWARAQHADVHHLHSFLPAVLGWWSYRWPQPLVVSVWGSDAAWYGPGPMPARRAAVLRFLFRRAAAVTLTSERQRADVAPYLPAGAEPTVIPWGVDCERFRPGPVPVEDRPPVVAFLKGFHHKYAPDVLANAMPRVITACPDVQFELVGDGPLRGAAERHVQRLGVAAHVTFRPPMPKEAVAEFLGGAAVNVVCSRHEAFGLVSLEAQACGVPTVNTNIPGLGETGGDGSGVVSIPPEAPDALADALVRLLQDRQERKQVGESGRRHVLRRFQWAASVQAMADVYERVAAA